MLIGLIRPSETRELTAEGESLEEIAEAFRAQTPDGWELLKSPVSMPKGTTKMTATATMARWGELQEIEAPDMDAMRAAVPSGWQLLTVRSV